METPPQAWNAGQFDKADQASAGFRDWFSVLVSFPAVLKASPLKKLQEPVIWGPQVRGHR